MVQDKIVFAVVPELQGSPMIMLGIPRQAWEHMQDGKTHTIDLTRIGMPIKLMLYGGESHDACLKMIEDACKLNNVALDDRRREDFTIDLTKGEHDGKR